MVNIAQSVCIKTCVKELTAFCLQHHIRVAVTESCTGGLLAAACTELAGASAWFDRGYVCYNNRAKKEQLGMPESLLAAFGAVSEQVAIALAVNTFDKSRAHAALSITGFAGPASDYDNHPVGTVFFGFASKWQPKGVALKAHFNGNRQEVREAAVLEGFEFLLRQLRLDAYKKAHS